MRPCSDGSADRLHQGASQRRHTLPTVTSARSPSITSSVSMPSNPKVAEKKLKTVKSHYAYETRKDVDLSGLDSLKLEACWPLIRQEIEKEIGGGVGQGLVCVPFITEAQFYEIACSFARIEQAGKPLGKLVQLIDEASSDKEYVEWLKDGSMFVDGDFKFPHESVKITLQDEQSKNKVRVIMMNMFRLTFPKNKSPIGKLRLKKDLQHMKQIDVITDVLMAKTVEFRANQGSSSRIFHLGNTAPLVFSVDTFELDDSGMITGMLKKCSKSCRIFNRADTLDRLYYPGVDNLEN